MAKYEIVKPVAFMHNGEALFYRTVPREPVEIDDIVASFLGDKVRRVDPFVEPFVETLEKGAFADTWREAIADGEIRTVNDIREMESLPPLPTEEPPKPKRKRKVEEEKPDGGNSIP